MRQNNEINNEETIHRIKSSIFNSQKLQDKEKCRMCNYVHEKGKFKCPAKDKTCFKCNKIGHFRKWCKSKFNHTTQKHNYYERTQVYNVIEVDEWLNNIVEERKHKDDKCR